MVINNIDKKQKEKYSMYYQSDDLLYHNSGSQGCCKWFFAVFYL